ncbi:uncharacterized protein BO87DRAFT_350287 [Aspergillus neoniger CBS 115656]|uniref:Uncharacterized protein n=1 Tax=Aspergillus neoniger (strain CBS 115656) TaxID=1448310 RepID=A0A318ZEX5_ASPNB|nr:hypothetical protein BO87DRAFT_350287 [Aspergillus neoniger CBS 115656]PYH38808.1 hypothetical protein BO87DRAFT_350287 [Aspergillus neoniger CBS 115656]
MADARKVIPQSPEEWLKEVKHLDLDKVTIHDAPLKSASRAEFEQFLLLRVVWKSYDSSKFLRRVDLSQALPDARTRLKGLGSWTNYKNSFTGPVQQGTFALARHYQLQVTRTDQDSPTGSGVQFTPVAHRTRSKQQTGQPPAQPDFTKSPPTNPDPNFDTALLDDESDSMSVVSSPLVRTPWSPIRPEDEFLYPPTKDEQIVNTALLTFLDSLTLHFDLSVGWSIHRMAFKATFTNMEFQARTDGYLADSKGDIKAIVEVKPVIRNNKETQIRIQESHQIVANLLADYTSPHVQRRNKPHRLIISQDRHEIYISVAEYDDNYIDYLQTGQTRNNPFLVMHQYGPWDTLNPDAMDDLGPIILALTAIAQTY